MAFRTDEHVTQEGLKEVFSYDPETGIFTRINSPHTWLNGKPTGKPNAVTGYVQVAYKGKNRQAHRLAWMYVYGFAPDGVIDHINGIRHDNRISNLRVCDLHENAQNAAYPIGECGYPGIHKKNWGYRAAVSHKGKHQYSRVFATPEEAYEEWRRMKAGAHALQPIRRQEISQMTPEYIAYCVAKHGRITRDEPSQEELDAIKLHISNMSSKGQMA